MITNLPLNTVDLLGTNLTESIIEPRHANWFEYRSIMGKSELSKQYASVCHQHSQQKKWVLFINPDEASLEQLANIHGVDVSKVLCVSVKNKHVGAQQDETSMNLNIAQIKSVLCRGNCSAVILSNAFLKQEEIVELKLSAEQGETQCLVLKTIQQKERVKLH
jgi:cell division inhibitor SulA